MVGAGVFVMHLLMYAFICASLVASRWRDAESYEPNFRFPLGPGFGTVGTVACLACSV